MKYKITVMVTDLETGAGAKAEISQSAYEQYNDIVGHAVSTALRTALESKQKNQNEGSKVEENLP